MAIEGILLYVENRSSNFFVLLYFHGIGMEIPSGK